MKFAFAGDRDLAVWVLDYILQSGYEPEALLLSGGVSASHADELMQLFMNCQSEIIIKGNDFKRPERLEELKRLDLDFIIGIHFPYIVPKEVLNIPKYGFINLHPAYLPYNKGWHTPSWAILEGTPVGATLHFMSEELDGGDIIHQKELQISPADTANILYANLKKLELDVFKEAWASLCEFSFTRFEQVEVGTKHSKKDLFQSKVQEIGLDEKYTGKELVNKLRGLTTNQLGEAAYFIENGVKYHIQVSIAEVTDEE